MFMTIGREHHQQRADGAHVQAALLRDRFLRDGPAVAEHMLQDAGAIGLAAADVPVEVVVELVEERTVVVFGQGALKARSGLGVLRLCSERAEEQRHGLVDRGLESALGIRADPVADALDALIGELLG